MNILDLLLSKSSHVQVLRVLYHAGEPITGREVERRSGLSNRATMTALEHLVDLSAVIRSENNRAYWFSINNDNYFVKRALRPAYEAEDLFWDDLRKTVRRVVRPRPIAAVATGPLARNESDPSGRLDLSLVFDSGRTRIRAFRSVERLTEVIWSRYAVEVECTLLDVNTVDDEEHNALWRRVAREGILLFGTLP
jgi:hypothetical protein